MTVDLDKARASRRREAKHEPIEVVFGKQTFSLPEELPFRSVELLVSLTGKAPGDMGEIFTEIIHSLFGAEQAQQFLDMNPSLPDVMELINALMADYGMPGGEAVPDA